MTDNFRKRLFLFFCFGLTTVFFFQNCGKMEANISTSNPSVNQPNQPDSGQKQPPQRVVPEYISNREIELDNKKTSEEDLRAVEYSVGGSDQFFYETNYRAKYESTLVTIDQTRLIVNSDECSNSRNLSPSEQGELTDLIIGSFGSKKINDSQKSENGCSFPRLVVDSKSITGSCPCPDFEIYYSSDSSCVSEGELIVSDLDSEGESNSETLDLMNKVKKFFKDQIDLVCPLDD